ncbi:MAG: thioesterase family protein [Chloroflexota bacterium]
MSGSRPPNLLAAPYRVRFDECGADGLVRASALLRYALDMAWRHSDSLGFTRAWYEERGVAWVVRAGELAIVAPIPSGAPLIVTTQVSGFRRVWSRRRTDARFEDGTPAFWSHTDFVMIDLARGLPGRVPPELPLVFETPPDPFEPGRVPLPGAPAEAIAIRSVVRPRDLDPNGHVNNAVYVDYLEEAVLVAGDQGAAALAEVPRRVRVEYLVAAEPGDRLVARAWRLSDAHDSDGGGWAWRLTDDGDRELARGRVLPGG